MRILLTLNSGQPGGMERHVLDLARGLSDRGHEVFIWCNEGPIADWYRQAGAQVFIEKVNVTFGIDVDPAYVFRLIKFLKKNRIDVIHCHELRAVGNSLIAANLARTKVKISHIHTPFSEWPIPVWKKRLYTFFYSFAILFLANCEIALTESRKRVKIKEGIKESKLRIIPNGVDTEKFNPESVDRRAFRSEMSMKYGIPQDVFIFGLISRITEEKGHEILVRAFAKLFEYRDIPADKLHLLLAGGGALEEKIKNLSKELGVGDKVTVTGRFPDDEIVKLYSTMDAFIFPSLAEGFGFVLVEAMAMRLPIICSNLEVLEEVGGSGVFSYFEAGDAHNLVEKMHELYVKKDYLENITDTAFERVSALYTLDKFVENYEELYKSFL